jgi:hypothetical protein
LQIVGKKPEELQPLLARRLLELIEKLASDRHAGSLTAPRHQRPRQNLDRLSADFAEQRLGKQRTSLLGNRRHQFLKKRNIDTFCHGWLGLLDR